MNPSPSPIASPIPSSRPAATPLQSALAAQIGALTHLVDGMERFQSVAVPRSTVDYLEGIIEKIHSTIDALNALYEADLNDASENRRAKWLLRDILRDLPDERDWMNPDTERSARALLGN